MTSPQTMSTLDAVPPMLPLLQAWDRYEAIRDRLPTASPPRTTEQVGGLLEIADRFDGFLFDSFGVLNVGETAIPGAADCLTALRRMGKRFLILTNAASYTGDAAFSKYARMGLDVARNEIVSSRDVTLAGLRKAGQGLRWGAICAEDDRFSDAEGLEVFDLLGRDAWDSAEGILFLSAARWTRSLQDRLVADLQRRPRPVVVGNPDLVAPREDGLSIEPGFWAHDLQDRTGLVPRCFGKPYPEAFETALAGMGAGRYAMIGDTLHTDILGGQAAGLSTILVTDHGLFAGRDTGPFITESAITPDFALPAI